MLPHDPGECPDLPDNFLSRADPRRNHLIPKCFQVARQRLLASKYIPHHRFLHAKSNFSEVPGVTNSPFSDPENAFFDPENAFFDPENAFSDPENEF